MPPQDTREVDSIESNRMSRLCSEMVTITTKIARHRKNFSVNVLLNSCLSATSRFYFADPSFSRSIASSRQLPMRNHELNEVFPLVLKTPKKKKKSSFALLTKMKRKEKISNFDFGMGKVSKVENADAVREFGREAVIGESMGLTNIRGAYH